MKREPDNFRAFHRRDAAKRWHNPWRPPAVLYCLGRGATLYYSSDKADPDDPSDVGGAIWRGYYHDHEASDTCVYLPRNEITATLGFLPKETIRPQWPDCLYWLGSADGFDVEIGNEMFKVKLDGKKGMRGMQLWGLDVDGTGDYLIAVKSQPVAGDTCVVWHGPELTLGWAGVDG